jgi:hypothetical protein
VPIIFVPEEEVEDLKGKGLKKTPSDESPVANSDESDDEADDQIIKIHDHSSSRDLE